MFQAMLCSCEEEMLSHTYLFSLHVVHIGMSVYKHGMPGFHKIAGVHISRHTDTHPDWGLCAFVFIEWA